MFPQDYQMFGGVSYKPSETKSASYNEENKTYTLLFNTGVEMSYKEQQRDKDGSFPSITSSYENGYPITQAYHINKGVITGSDKEDYISLFNCHNSYVDVSNDEKYDIVSIANLNDRDNIWGNRVKYDARDSIEACGYSTNADGKPEQVKVTGKQKPDSLFGWFKNLFNMYGEFKQGHTR